MVTTGGTRRQWPLRVISAVTNAVHQPPGPRSVAVEPRSVRSGRRRSWLRRRRPCGPGAPEEGEAAGAAEAEGVRRWWAGQWAAGWLAAERCATPGAS